MATPSRVKIRFSSTRRFLGTAQEQGENRPCHRSRPEAAKADPARARLGCVPQKMCPVYLPVLAFDPMMAEAEKAMNSGSTGFLVGTPLILAETTRHVSLKTLVASASFRKHGNPFGVQSRELAKTMPLSKTKRRRGAARGRGPAGKARVRSGCVELAEGPGGA